MLTDRQPDAPPVTVELRTGDQPIVLETRDGTIHTRLGPAERADATITGPPKPILGLLLGLLELADAKQPASTIAATRPSSTGSADRRQRSRVRSRTDSALVTSGAESFNHRG